MSLLVPQSASSANPLLSLRGGVDPSPYRSPLTWTGGFASGRSVQDGPRRLQERKSEKEKNINFHRFWKDFGLLGGPRGDSRHSGGATLISAPPFFDRSPPRWPQERPEGSQERPRSAPRGSQEAPRSAQETSKRLPREPQEDPRCSPRYARRLQERKGEKAKHIDLSRF